MGHPETDSKESPIGPRADWTDFSRAVDTEAGGLGRAALGGEYYSCYHKKVQYGLFPCCWTESTFRDGDDIEGVTMHADQ